MIRAQQCMSMLSSFAQFFDLGKGHHIGQGKKVKVTVPY